ncbi:MAG: IS21 family transposase, partial [Rikenellaceae bacterium]
VEDYLSNKPSYKTRSRPRRVITDTIKHKIINCLEINKKRKEDGMHKQCMSKMDIYELLIDQGFSLSYPTVCKYICHLERSKQKPQEAYIRGHYEPGDECEFDWGEVKLTIDGNKEVVQMAIFTLAHSNARYCYLFTRQDTLAFMEAHRNFFRDTKGVPCVMVYDNMRVAIKKFAGSEKQPTDALMSLKNFYRFNHRFCNICSGNEKGHVERSVAVIRKKAFSYKVAFNSLSAANEHVATVCERLNRAKGEAVEVDLSALRPEYNMIGCFSSTSYKVDKWSTICMKQSYYSVPDNLVGKYVDVKIYSEKIVVFYQGKKVATHERKYSQRSWSIKLEHYISTLAKKPGALHSSLALKQADDAIRRLYNDCLKDTPREFVLLVDYINKSNYTVDDVIDAYVSLKSKEITHPNADQIKMYLSKADEIKMPTVSDYSSVEYREIEDKSISTLASLTNIMNNKDLRYDIRTN